MFYFLAEYYDLFMLIDLYWNIMSLFYFIFNVKDQLINSKMNFVQNYPDFVIFTSSDLFSHNKRYLIIFIKIHIVYDLIMLFRFLIHK